MPLPESILDVSNSTMCFVSQRLRTTLAWLLLIALASASCSTDGPELAALPDDDLLVRAMAEALEAELGSACVVSPSATVVVPGLSESAPSSPRLDCDVGASESVWLARTWVICPDDASRDVCTDQALSMELEDSSGAAVNTVSRTVPFTLRTGEMAVLVAHIARLEVGVGDLVDVSTTNGFVFWAARVQF